MSATSAKTGLELVEKTPPDLIVLDIVMPEIDGFEACQRLKTDKVTMDIPVIMITGGAIDSDKALQKTFEVGAIDFITKPIRAIEFLGRIKSVLTLKQAHDRMACFVCG